MLLLVLVLVIAALGLLVAALVTAVMLWAWFSVGASALAAALLIADWWRRRRPGASPAVGRPDAVPAAARAAPGEADPVASLDDADADLDHDTEPVEEDTDAADLLAVAELSLEVRVVDERPRYHLAACRWLDGRPTLGLPVREARELGFTPCAICAPDSTLAAAQRPTAT